MKSIYKILAVCLLFINTVVFSQTASDLFNNASKCTGLISDGRGFGSGFFINKNIFVTNYHVINRLKENNIEIRTQNKEFSILKVIELNKVVDLAILQVTDSTENYLRIADPADIKIGQTVYAIGNPSAPDEKVFKNTFTNGIINNILNDKLKGKDYTVDSKVILHSADLNPGNSGGPLLNEKGELVGINAYVRYNIEMMKFAIHVDELISLLDKNVLSYEKGSANKNSQTDNLSENNKGFDQNTLKTLDSLLNGQEILTKDSVNLLVKSVNDQDNTFLYVLIFLGIGCTLFVVILFSGKKNNIIETPVQINSLPETLIHNKNHHVSKNNYALQNNQKSFLLYDDRRIDLKNSDMIAGRDSTCDISLKDNNLSRFHFKITFLNSSYIITDLASKNGTFVNGNKINSKTLSSGDIISVGHNKILFKAS